MPKAINFTAHAEQKLLLLNEIGVSKEKIVETIKKPDKIQDGYFGRKIAQGALSRDLVLRIVFEESNKEILIITVYPGEKRRYE